MPATGSGRRIRRGLAEWSALLAEQAASGESQKAFCAARGLALSSFFSAKQRLRPRPIPQSPRADFVPVQVAQCAASVDADAGELLGWDIELTLGAGVVLRLRQR